MPEPEPEPGLDPELVRRALGGSPTPREPTCLIVYRTPETLNLVDAIRVLADTTAIMAFAATTAAIPAEQLPATARGTDGGWFIHWVPFWRLGDDRPASGEDELATVMPVRRLSYASPLEIVLGAPEHYVAAGLAVLWAIPGIVARFSRLRARFARDRLDRDVYEAFRGRVQRDDVLAGLDNQAFGALYNIEKAITEDRDKSVDSDTVETPIDDYLKFLDEHGIQEDEGFGEGHDAADDNPSDHN